MRQKQRFKFGTPRAIIVVLLSLCASICTLALPIYTIQVYDRVLSQRNFSTFITLSFATGVFIVLENIFRFLMNYHMLWRNSNLKHVDTCDLVERFSHIPKLHLKKFTLAHMLNLTERCQAYRDNVVQHQIIRVTDIFLCVMYILLLAMISYHLLCMLLAIVSVFAAAALYINRRIAYYVTQRTEADNKKFDGLFSILRCLPWSRYNGNEGSILLRQELLEKNSINYTYRLSKMISHIYAVSNFAAQISTVTAIFIGVPLVIANKLSVGGLIACIIISTRLVHPIKQLLMSFFYQTFNQHDQQLIDEFYNVPTQHFKPLSDFKTESIVGNNISVSSSQWHKQEDVEIAHFSFEAEPGDIVGFSELDYPNTNLLIDLLLGQVVPDRGTLQYFGYHASELNNEDFMKVCSYIDFSRSIVPGTIFDNIAGYENITSEVIINLCERLEIHNDIVSLPQGYHTQLDGNNHDSYSNVLLQSICIARALVHEPKLIIINTDDNLIESHVYTMLYRYIIHHFKNKIIFIVGNDNIYLRACTKHYRFMNSNLRLINHAA